MRTMPTLAALALVGTIAGCKATKADVGKNPGTNGTTDCVDVVGGADCSPGGGGGTGTGGGGTGGIDTWVGNEDPGSGPGGALYRIEADVDAFREDTDTGFWYQTDMRVEIWDDQGQPLSGLDVHLDTLSAGDTVLVEDPGNAGRYEATVDVYARTYTLQIEPGDPTAFFEAQAVGPEPHTFVNWAPEPWDVAGPDISVQWSPFGSDFCEIDTRGDGNQTIDDDGEYQLAAGNLDQEPGATDDERVRLLRRNDLDLTGALTGSWFRVGVEIEKDPVDTTDSRVGALQGQVDLDPAFAGETGTVYVLAWGDALDPPQDAYSLWTSIPDGMFDTVGDYLLSNLEPGDWYVLVYLDADGSDTGLPAPDGPTDGDPWDDGDVAIDPNNTSIRDFTLDRLWNGW